MNRKVLYAVVSQCIAATAMFSWSGTLIAVEEADSLKPVQVAHADKATDSRAVGTPASLAITGNLVLPMLNPSPSLPQVWLSEQHKQLCRKRVGDQLDPIALPDVEGKQVQLLDQLSDQWTVLVFWSERSVGGYEQFRRIPVDVLAKFAPYRVKVVAVNVGGTVAETKRLTNDAANKILSLADTESKLFDQVAEGYLPRTYVLDREGRIVWFDLEYSESTRRSLDNALSYFIQQAAANSQQETSPGSRDS